VVGAVVIESEGWIAVEITLVDAVAAVRDELLVAAARGAAEDVHFVVDEVVLEFAVELREDRSANAGVKAWVVSAGAEGSGGRSDTHRVSVTLHPRGTDGGEVLVGGDDTRAEGPGDVSRHIGR
jgi:hypothetical protein